MINMPGTNLVLVDSDAIIGLINPDDPNHSKCIKISEYLSSSSFGTIAPYPIILEAATALSRQSKINRPDLAVQILDGNAKVEDRPKLNEDIAELVSESFRKNTSRKNTPFDHYLCALAKKNNIKYVFSFDAFYKKQGLIPAEELLKK
jgi:predicted nucleic acid-binding protein